MRTLRLSYPTWDDLAYVADDIGESVSQFMRTAVEERLKQYQDILAKREPSEAPRAPR